MKWLDAWWKWWLFAVGTWLFPASIWAVFGCCYTEHFGDPPCACWAVMTIDGLFFCNFVAIVAFFFPSYNRSVRLLLAIPMSIAELTVSGCGWLFGGISVSGFYF